MLKSVIVGLSVLLTAGSALAQPASLNSIEDHNLLLKVINAVGVPVTSTHPICNQDIYGAYFTNGSALVICPRGDQDERFDTIRHEAWHMYQDMRDCSLTDTNTIEPVFQSGLMPPLLVEQISQVYPAGAVTTESEAFWVAQVFDAYSIAKLVFLQAQKCGLL